MSFNDAAFGTSDSEDIISTQGNKRDASSLFVDDADFDEHLDNPSTHSTKRVKLGSGLDIDSLLAGLKVGPEGDVMGYDAEAEGRPRLAIYHPSFKAAERTISEICSDFMTTYEQVKAEYDCKFPEIDHICEHNLKPFLTPQAEYPLVGPIALLGSAGIGKSSFTGCILDSRGAAPESDGTKRGTSVVHEYSAAMTNQKALFQVGAIYYTEQQIAVLVKSHCDDIFKYLTECEELEDEEIDALQKEYENAIEFFQTVLCDQDGFESEEDAQAYFDERKEEDVEDVVVDLTALIEAFKDTRNLQDNVEYRSAESHGELAEIFKLVSRPPPTTSRSQQPHPWPLIVKVQILQEKELLNAGVILADCPGIGDSNRGVVNSTMNYLKQAGTILIFEKIERIKDNQSLDRNIRECLRIGKRSNIHLVVTMIDLKQRIKPEDRDDLSPRDRHLLEEAEATVRELKKRRAILKQKKSNANRDEYQAIDMEYEEIPKKIAFVEARIDQINIEIRNKDVAEHLKGKIRQLERSDTAPDLPVHFISNTQYQQHLQGYELEKPPVLDIEGTGVPGVRQMLLEIPSRGKSNTLRRMCCTGLPVNLHAIIGILTKAPFARKEEVAKLIEKVLSGYSTILSGLQEDLEELFHRHISMTIVTNESKWADKASNLVKSWERIHASTFMAFCRKNGHWRVKKGEVMISWNYKIQTIFEDRLILAFNTLDSDIARTSANTASNLKALFQTLEEKLKDCEDFQGNAGAEAFFEVIRLTRDDLNRQLDKLFNELIDNIAVIRNSAILEDKDEKESSGESSVAQAMEKTYTACELMSLNVRRNKKPVGSGRKASKKSSIHPQCVDAIRQRLMGTGQEKSVFAAVSDKAKGAFDDLFETWKNLCEDALKKGCKAISDDFDHRFAYDDIKTEEDIEAAKRTEAAKRVKEMALETLGRTEELKQHMADCEAFEKAGRA